MASLGFEWILFAAVGFVVGWLIWGKEGKTVPAETAPEE